MSPSLRSVLRRRPAEEAEQPPPSLPRPPRRALPPPGELRRERRTLLRAREERVRDLGGLVLEMYRQDAFREHLLYEQCAEVAALEERLLELELLLEARRPPAARCGGCGAPVLWGSRYCPQCGRQLAQPGTAPPPAGEA
jgi:hypothetical protein